MSATRERVWFRLIHLPCCGHLLCWVNPRLPAYCPECGKHVLTELRVKDSPCFKLNDAEATLTYHVPPV
jgi:hypothetical protein